MDTDVLRATARRLVAPEKGILAADESTGTIGMRFDQIGIESTEANRRPYRDMLLTAPGLEEHMSGVIFFDETIRQSTKDGPPFTELLASWASSRASRSTSGQSRWRCSPVRRSRRDSTGSADGSQSTGSSARASPSGARRS